MKQFILKYSFAMWLGFSLGAFADISSLTWEFYAIVVPTMLLMVIGGWDVEL